MSLSWKKEEGPFQPPREVTSRGSPQTILTLGLEIEFILTDIYKSDNPHALIQGILESNTISLKTLYSNFCGFPINTELLPELPETRGDIRLDNVSWFARNVSTEINKMDCFGSSVTYTNTRYNRKHYILMDESGIDPRCEPGTVGSTREEIGEDDVIYIRQSMEIATPIMREGSWRRVVCGMLGSLQDSGVGIEFSDDTGLHVHVGCRGGWSICQLKKIIKAVVIFEQAMDSYHPESRVRSIYDTDVENIGSNTELMEIELFTRLERVRYIDSKINSKNARTRAEGLIQICELTNEFDCKSTKYNFLPIRTSGTVEFRQAIASLDQARVCSWVDVVLNFVSAAICTTRMEFEELAKTEDDGHNMLGSFLDYGKKYRLHRRYWDTPIEPKNFEDELNPWDEQDEPVPENKGADNYEAINLSEEMMRPNPLGNEIEYTYKQSDQLEMAKAD